MGSIYQEVHVNASREEVWRKVRDVGNIASLLPSVLTDSRLVSAGTRTCALVGGGEIVEEILGVDNQQCRVAYRIVQGPRQLSHHSASMQVFADGDGARFIWITDFLPDDATSGLADALATGSEDLARTLGAG
jgi:Polyketide cyclase / dehydrase and lipid transport